MTSRAVRVRLSSLVSLSLCLGLSVSVGCGDEGETAELNGDGEEDSATGEEDSATGEEDSATSEDTTTGEDPNGLEQLPATGITITHVEANQGTEVRIAQDGQWVEGSNRLAPLARHRNTLIRVHYNVAPDFEARELEARLLLGMADGTQKVYTHIKLVDGPSAPNTLNGTFFFGLAAEEGDVAPETTFKVEIHELAAGAGGNEDMGVWESPPEISPIGIQPEPVELKIVLVPYHHIYEGIDRYTDTSEETLGIITDYLYEHNPVEVLDWELHDFVEWELPMDNLGSVLGPMAAMRDNELAFPNVYYHALFPVPNGGVAGVAGIASVPGPGKGEGSSRVSATALGNNPNGSRGTVVHEVGHNEGLQHVYCPFADSASPDPNYPFQNGVIGTWGFGILSFQLYAPDSHYDYMSYCGPSWVSRWSVRNTWERARILTSWDYESPENGGFDLSLGPRGYSEKTLLYGSLNADGTEFWWTGHGTLPELDDVYSEPSDHYIELRSKGEVVDSLQAVVRYTNDYSTRWLISELPASVAKLEGIDELRRIDERQEAHLLPASRVQLSTR